MKRSVPAALLTAFASSGSVIVSWKRDWQKLAFLHALLRVFSLLTHFTVLTWFAI